MQERATAAIFVSGPVCEAKVEHAIIVKLNLDNTKEKVEYA